MKIWPKHLLIAFSIFLIALGLFAFPLLRGQYRFRRMAEGVKQGMLRSDVLQLADRVGYLHHYVWPEDLNEGEEQSPESITDEFNFNYFMLSSVVFITYDSEGKVKEVIIDQ